MLDLQTRIYLKEIVRVAAHDELYRADAAIAELATEPHCVGEHPLTQPGRKVDRRRLLDQLLMTPLQRAFALEQVDDIPSAVTRDLHLDVAAALTAAFPR